MRIFATSNLPGSLPSAEPKQEWYHTDDEHNAGKIPPNASGPDSRKSNDGTGGHVEGVELLKAEIEFAVAEA